MFKLSKRKRTNEAGFIGGYYSARESAGRSQDQVAMEDFVAMTPIPTRKETTQFIDYEFGLRLHKDIVYTGKGNGGKQIIGTCVACNNFQVVFQSSTKMNTDHGFVIRPDLCRFAHKKISDSGIENDCLGLIHNATTVSKTNRRSSIIILLYFAVIFTFTGGSFELSCISRNGNGSHFTIH